MMEQDGRNMKRFVHRSKYLVDNGDENQTRETKTAGRGFSRGLCSWPKTPPLCPTQDVALLVAISYQSAALQSDSPCPAPSRCSVDARYHHGEPQWRSLPQCRGNRQR